MLEAGAEPGPALVRAVRPSDFTAVPEPQGPDTGPSGANIEIVRALLEAGADADAVDDRGHPILLVAIANYQFEVAELLLEGGISSALVRAESGFEWMVSKGVVAVEEGVLRPGENLSNLMSGSASGFADLSTGLSESGMAVAVSSAGIAEGFSAVGTEIYGGIGGGVGGVTDLIPGW